MARLHSRLQGLVQLSRLYCFTHVTLVLVLVRRTDACADRAKKKEEKRKNALLFSAARLVYTNTTRLPHVRAQAA
jgi:hypothetical protein